MNRSISLFCLYLFALFAAAPAPALSTTLGTGSPAPDFTLNDMGGNSISLSMAKNNPVTVLFFFDAASRPSQETLMLLDKLSRQYKSAGLSVWGITRSEKPAVQAFIEKARPGFPIMLDNLDVSRIYNAKLILPVVCTLSRDLSIVDYYQGGGKTLETMMVSLAQRQLNRRQAELAAALAEQVYTTNPQNIEARSVQGYAALKNGQLDKADQVFEKLSVQPGNASIIGKEGRAAVLARKGQTDQAMQLVSEIEKKAPDRVYSQVIKGDILARQGKIKEAAAAYEMAVQKTQSAPFQKAEAYNQLGRYQAHLGNIKQARKLYDHAIELDPYYLEPTSNKGVTYEKEGRWDQALNEYRKALALDSADTIATILARKAEEMMALQKDQQKSRRIDQLVQTLAERFRQQKTLPPPEDTWTSRPMVLSLVDFQEKGGLAPRDGLASALATQLGELLNASGRVQVVERALIERLLDELNLGSSELADQETALKLGKVLAAKLIATGVIFHLPDSTMLSMRLIDTETTKVPKSYSASMSAQSANLDRQLYELNRNILETIIKTYPLRAYIVDMQNGKALLNIGAQQGIVEGTRFSVIEQDAPIVYKGKTLAGKPKKIGELEIVSVEPGLCLARVINKERDLKTDDKVEEIFPGEKND